MLTQNQTQRPLEPFVFCTTSRTIFNLPVWISLERGFFREEGLDVSVKVADNLDHEIQLVTSGEVQVGLSAPDAIIAAKGDAAATTIIAGNAERLPHFIMANARIKTFADLRGATFGVAGAHDGTTSLLGEIAKAGGFPVSELKLTVTGGAPNRVPLLREGKIDAAMQPFPHYYMSEADGLTNLGPLSNLVPYYLFSAYVVNKRWARENRGKLVAFLRALTRGNDAMFADADAAAAVVAREMQAPIELARRAVDDALRMQILSRDLSVSRTSLETVFKTMQDSGRVSKDAQFTWSAHVDDSYLADSRKTA
ncbi:MAG: transporter substrate-binding protein [Ramlibacter sp.]|nr:transporter substrate-binding protein [Ramlibacter sp.]